mgnify:CR=1 FL=1
MRIQLTPRQAFIQALKRLPIQGHVPHFEIVFSPVMEAFGMVHPKYRKFPQWQQFTQTERDLQLADMARCYVQTARRYNHSAIHVHPLTDSPEDTIALLKVVREMSGDEFFLMIHGDPTPAIPDGNSMMDFSVRMYDDPESIHRETKAKLKKYQNLAQALSRYPGLLDGFILCSDYCFSQNPNTG